MLTPASLFAQGLHCIKLWRNRSETRVIVDDRLPVDSHGRLIFGSSRSGSEFWVPIFEKAYAKLGGCYETMDGGIESDCLVDLTGGVSKILDLYADKRALQNGRTWKLISNFHAKKDLMGCANNGKASSAGGIQKDHAYGILGVFDVTNLQSANVKLVKLRNPWGSGEWEGAWSSSSREWKTLSEQWIQAISPNGSHQQKDGTFFMCWHDFYTHFEKLYLCKPLETGWERSFEPGQWAGPSAGGCTNFPTWVDNPQFQVEVKETTRMYIVLNQADNRGGVHGRKKGKYDSIGLAVYRRGERGRRQLDTPADDSGDMAARAEFTNTRDRTVEITLEPAPWPYVIIPMKFEPRKEGKFKLQIYSDKSVELRAVTPKSGDWHEKRLAGAWTAGRSGGCRNHKTWRENPSFQLRVNETQGCTAALKGTHRLAVRVSQEWGEGCPAIGFYVTAADGRDAARTDTFVSGEAAVKEMQLPPGQTYTITACTFNPSTLGAFTLTVYGPNAAAFDIGPAE